MENAVIGVFDDFSHAREAADALTAAGFRQWAVQITPTEESQSARQAAMNEHREPPSEGWSIGNFFRTLFGMDADHEHAHSYAEALRRGSFLVTVEAEREADLERARELMGRYHPIDIEERAAHWRSQGWSRYEPHGEPYTEEEIRMERDRYTAVPNPAVPGNMSRVRSYTRATGNPAAAAENGTGMPRTGSMSDMAAMTGGATSSPGNGRVSVKESQALGGGAGFGADTHSAPTGSAGPLGSVTGDNADLHESSGTMSNAAMRDSTAPDIYTLDPDADFRTHWQKSAGVSEGRYEDFAPAYRFGANLRKNDALKDYHDWNDIEPEARRSWERAAGSSPWDKARDAVRYGWEKMKDQG